MAKTVGAAFNEFMLNKVNLLKEDNDKGKKDVSNLLSNINQHAEEDFFKLYTDINMYFGSFARKTKCQPLNDIDILVGLSGEGATYDESSWSNISIEPSLDSFAQQACKDNDGKLNSRMVLGKLKSLLKDTEDLRSCEINTKQEAVVLNYKTKDWSLDIVPCFYTKPQNDGRAYYLIPNGKGNWMKTDPRIDKEHMLSLNTKHQGKVLPAIRLVKYWNNYAKVLTIDGYVLELLLAIYFEDRDECPNYIDCLFRNLMEYLSTAIWNKIEDPKGIQGDLNYLTYEERYNFSEKAENIFTKAKEAVEAEVTEKNIEKSINLWGNIFGDDFPTYG